MPAFMMPLDIRQRAFLESIRWADVACPDQLVIDIDFAEFTLKVIGDEKNVETYSQTVRKLFFSCGEKIENDERDCYG